MIKRWRILSILFLLVGLANLIRAGLRSYIAPALEDCDLSLPLPLLGGFYLLFGLGCSSRRGHLLAATNTTVTP